MSNITLPKPDTHCWDDDSKPPKDVWSYSPELVRKIIEADRAQRGEPVAWRAPNWSHHGGEYAYRDADDPFICADGAQVGEPLYTAPRPSQLANLCGHCGRHTVEEPWPIKPAQPERKPMTDQDTLGLFNRIQLRMRFTDADARPFASGVASAEFFHGIK